jgi:hypothetical protein
VTGADDESSSIPRGGRFLEAAAVGVLGGALGAAATSPLGLAVPVGVIAAANGAVSGWRRVYDWHSAKGVLAFFLDSTWSFPMTGAGLFANVVGSLSKNGGYVADLSERQGRHVFARGFRPRRGFVITLGNVISGAGDTTRARRRRLITDHEAVHIWQARWLGPIFPIVYVGWTVVGGAAGIVVWAVRQGDESLAKVVETCGYYLNPLEWWAYSRDDHWPPGGKVSGLGWRRPIVKPFSS